jgi:hypothetical protein
MSHETRRSFLTSLLSSIAGAIAAGSLLFPRRAGAEELEAYEPCEGDTLAARKDGGPAYGPKYGGPATKYGGPATKYGGPATKYGGPPSTKYGGPSDP